MVATLGLFLTSFERRFSISSSENGSPVDNASDGALVATISKKRRDGPNQSISPAKFDINVGEGKFLNLNDPSNVHTLDDDMKNEALNQLKIL